ncbi:MAG: hypoxanthine phosphoribosyltransferase [Eubacteriales bacterium]|nr:hypoxanthine phosphoribosyltransferase [Eubacteriales bacterium]
MKQDIEKVLLSEEAIAAKVKELGAQIAKDYADKNPLIVSVLRGSFVFMADLVRAIDVPCTVDFMSVSSYGSGTTSTGEVKITKDFDVSIEGRHLIIVEDILDSGRTLSYLMKTLKARGAASIALCTFLDKPERRVVPVEVAYKGFTVPDAFIVGYGLDYDQKYRNLPYVGVLKPSVYEGK